MKSKNVPTTIVRSATLGGSALLPKPAFFVPELKDILPYAPPNDRSEHPDQNIQWYDKGPATRIGY
jgi:hypothetical protein